MSSEIAEIQITETDLTVNNNAVNDDTELQMNTEQLRNFVNDLLQEQKCEFQKCMVHIFTCFQNTWNHQIELANQIDQMNQAMMTQLNALQPPPKKSGGFFSIFKSKKSLGPQTDEDNKDTTEPEQPPADSEVATKMEQENVTTEVIIENELDV